VPVKPTKLACGSASRMWRAKPSTKSYWLRWASSAMTTMLRRSDSLKAFGVGAGRTQKVDIVQGSKHLGNSGGSLSDADFTGFRHLISREFAT